MRRFVLAMLSLFLLLLVFGCASTRSTRKGKLAAESQLTATTEGNRKQREAKHSYRVYKSGVLPGRTKAEPLCRTVSKSRQRV